jgi:hypothetical protein
MGPALAVPRRPPSGVSPVTGMCHSGSISPAQHDDSRSARDDQELRSHRAVTAHPGRLFGRPLDPNEVQVAAAAARTPSAARPRLDGRRHAVDVPGRVGPSLRNDYNHPTEITDNRGGLASLGVFGTLAFTAEPARFGSWHVHGGVEWHNHGATPRALECQHRRIVRSPTG